MSGDAEPDVGVEEEQTRNLVLGAVAGLPDDERMVTSLLLGIMPGHEMVSIVAFEVQIENSRTGLITVAYPMSATAPAVKKHAKMLGRKRSAD